MADIYIKWPPPQKIDKIAPKKGGRKCPTFMIFEKKG